MTNAEPGQEAVQHLGRGSSRPEEAAPGSEQREQGEHPSREGNLGSVCWGCSCRGQTRTGRLRSMQWRGFDVFSPLGMSRSVPNPHRNSASGSETLGRLFQPVGRCCSDRATSAHVSFQLMCLQEKPLVLAMRVGKSPPPRSPAARHAHCYALSFCTSPCSILPALVALR